MDNMDNVDRHVQRGIANRRIKGFVVITMLVTILASYWSDAVLDWWHWYWVVLILIAFFGIWTWYLVHLHLQEFKKEYEELRTLRAKERANRKQSQPKKEEQEPKKGEEPKTEEEPKKAE